MKKVLFFFPHNPYPPKSGAHKRCLELLTGLKALGCHVILASSTYTSERPWTDASIEAIRKDLGCDVALHSPGSFELRLTGYFNRVRNFEPSREIFRRLKKYILYDGGIQPACISAGMKLWFKRLTRKSKPAVIFMNYAYFDCIVSRSIRKHRICVMEMHDLVTMNNRLQASIMAVIGMEGLAAGDIPASALDLDFFHNKGITPDPVEFLIYDTYDYTLCISEVERELVQQNSPHTRAVYLPMTQLAAPLENSYHQDALFTVGPNSFNVQGYYIFVNRILPLIKKLQPDFRLTVAGEFFYHISPRISDGINYIGFVADLHEFYEASRFFICPVFGGTGQQVKIVEAMANGLAVVAFEDAARRSPLRHGENGLVAKNEEEFSEHVIALWSDQALCRRLGQNARNTIAQEYSHNRLMSELAPLLADRDC